MRTIDKLANLSTPEFVYKIAEYLKSLTCECESVRLHNYLDANARLFEKRLNLYKLATCEKEKVAQGDKAYISQERIFALVNWDDYFAKKRRFQSNGIKKNPQSKRKEGFYFVLIRFVNLN